MKLKSTAWSILLASLFSFTSNAKEIRGTEAEKKIKGAEKIVENQRCDVPEFVLFRKEAEPSFDKFESIAHQQMAIAPAYGFKLLNSDNDQLGMVHYRYQETFNGIPIEGTMYIVHVKNGKIVSMNGQLYNAVNTASAASMSEADALKKALEFVHADVYRWQNPANENQIKYIKNDPAATWYPKGELFLAPINNTFASDNFRLTYRFDI